MNIRFSEKDLSGSSYIPEGETEVSVVKIENGNTSKGEQMITVTMRDRLGREQKERFTLGEKALWKLAGFAVAAGLDKKALSTNGLDPAKLMGAKLLMVKVQDGVRDYQGSSVKNYECTYFPTRGENASATNGSVARDEDIPF